MIHHSAQKWCLIFHAVTAMAFTYDPVSPLLGTFPDIKPGSPLFVLAITEIEVRDLVFFGDPEEQQRSFPTFPSLPPTP